MKRIYTIGYSAFPELNSFFNVLRKFDISCIVDVRSTPSSKYFKDYDKVSLQKEADKQGISYLSFAYEFGARQTDERFYTNGYLDFNKYCHSTKFWDGYKKLVEGEEKDNHTYVLMCSEKDPIDCHRSIMIGKALFGIGIEVLNIMFDGTTTSQNVIDERLLQQHFPNRNQLSIFDLESDIDYLSQAYKKQNAKIGFKLEED